MNQRFIYFNKSKLLVHYQKIGFTSLNKNQVKSPQINPNQASKKSKATTKNP